MKIIEEDEIKARLIVHDAVNRACNNARKTYGPKGLNSLLGSKFFKPLLTNDGLRAVKSTVSDNELENEVIRVVEDAMQTTNDEAGDARTLTAILLQEIFNTGYEQLIPSTSLVKKNPDAQAVREKIMEASKLVIDEIKTEAKEITTLEDIIRVIFAAVENKNLADLIADVVFKVGKDGIIKVEEVDSLGIQTFISEGMEVGSGYVSADMVTNDKKESVVEDACILITDTKIINKEQVSGFATGLELAGIKDLVIFATDFDQAIIKAFNLDRLQNDFRILAVKIPAWDKGLFEDICTISGAVLNDKLGKVSRIVSNFQKTVLIGGVEDKTKAINDLQTELALIKSPFEKEKLETRIARLNGKIGLLEVGAVTAIDRLRLRDKVEDGKHAGLGALQEGALKGAGTSLNEIADRLGDNILVKALRAPYEQIRKTLGEKEIGEVIDSAKSIRVAFESATTTAANLLTVGFISADKNERDTE